MVKVGFSSNTQTWNSYLELTLVQCNVLKQGGLDLMELKVNGKFSSKVKIFPNPFWHILEIINRNCHKRWFFGCHDALKIYGAPKVCSEIINLWLGWEQLIFSIPSRTNGSIVKQIPFSFLLHSYVISVTQRSLLLTFPMWNKQNIQGKYQIQHVKKITKHSC